MVRPRCVTTGAAGETCNGGPRYVRGYPPTPAECSAVTEPAGLAPATSFEWFRVIKSIEFGTCTIGRRNVSGGTIKLICGILASYADADGSNVFPSIARLALDAEISEEVTKAVMRHLREVGLLDQVERGGGRKRKTAKYQLTIPDDLLAKVKVRSPSEVEALTRRGRGPVDDDGS